MPLYCQFNQFIQKFAVFNAGGFPEFGIHADIGEARQRVDLINDHLVVRCQEHIHTRHAAALQRLAHDPTLRTALGLAARERYTQAYTPAHMAQAVLDVYLGDPDAS